MIVLRRRLLLVIIVILATIVLVAAFEPAKKSSGAAASSDKTAPSTAAKAKPRTKAPTPSSPPSRASNDDVEDDDEDYGYAPTPVRNANTATRDEQTPAPLTFDIDHDISGGNTTAALWTRRGTVEINFGSAQSTRATIKFSAQTFTDGAANAFNKLLANDGAYRLRFTPTTGAYQPALLTSIPACQVNGARFHESFTFHSDIYAQIIAVTQLRAFTQPPLTLTAAGSNTGDCDRAPPSAIFVQSKGKLSFGRNGEKPQHVRMRYADPAMYPNGVPGAIPGGPPADANKEPVLWYMNIWNNYWMYIVPVAIILIMQVMSAPPEEQQPEQRD